MEKEEITLGNRIAGLMERNGYTQKELAEEIGITEAAISRYINDYRVPRSETIAKIAKTLHTTTDYLLGVKIEDKGDDLYEELQKLLSKTISTKFAVGFAYGYEVGKNDGYIQGRDAGLEAGGFEEGYNEGYKAGVEKHDSKSNS